MFLAAVARLHWDVTRNRKFDGNIWMWPMITHKPAKSNSRNRPAGTMITKQINIVNADVYRE